jgi:hypothetical protein
VAGPRDRLRPRKAMASPPPPNTQVTREKANSSAKVAPRSQKKAWYRKQVVLTHGKAVQRYKGPIPVDGPMYRHVNHDLREMRTTVPGQESRQTTTASKVSQIASRRSAKARVRSPTLERFLTDAPAKPNTSEGRAAAPTLE